jgi:PAS domain S-box-containing protein
MPQPNVQDETREAAAPLSDLKAFQAAIEAARVGICSWDIKKKNLTWSANLDDVHGPSKGDADGAFSLAPDDLNGKNQTGLLAAMAESLGSAKPYRLEFRIAAPADSEETWFEASTTVLVKDGEVVQLFGVCRDITRRLQINREVHVRARQQDALARLGERALTESELQAFFNVVVATVAELLDVQLVKILELLPGDSELLLRAGAGWRAELIGKATESTGRGSQAGYTLAAGRPVIVEDLASETRFTPPQMHRDHGVVSGVSVPIAGSDGRAYGVLGAHSTKRRKFAEYEVLFLNAVANVVAGAIQRQQADQRQHLMIRELRHRSGNLFSQLLALFSQTAKGSRNVADLAIKYEARVLALANAHRLITEGGWKSTSLNELLNTLFGPFAGRLSFSGPSVLLEPDPTFGLSLALHELATNASKHGSLSVPEGTIDLAWSVARTQQGLTLVLDWKERNGPPPKRTRRPGFGSRLINMVIERQLNGRVEQTYAPEGLVMRLEVPLTHERWPGGARTTDPDLP